jgi:hypothetical protein
MPLHHAAMNGAPLERTSPILRAIWHALTAVSKLPESQHVLELRDRCLACERTARIWVHEPPTPEEREGLMKRVLALQVMVTKAYRVGRPQPRP